MQDGGHQTDIEVAPVPVGRGQRLQHPARLDRAQAPAALILIRSGYVAVGDEVHALFEQLAYRVFAGAGPGKADPGVRVRQPCAQREGVDARRYAVDGVAGNIAYAVGLCHRSGYGPGYELSLVDAAVIGAHAGVGHGDGAVEHLYVRVLRRELAAGGDQRRGRGEDDLRTVLGGLFHDGVHVAVRLEIVGLHRDLAAHGLFHRAAAQVVARYPVAVDGVGPVYEGHVQVVRQEDRAEDTVEYAL